MVRGSTVKYCFFIFAALGAVTTLVRLRTLDSVGITNVIRADAGSPGTAPEGPTLDAGKDIPGVASVSSKSPERDPDQNNNALRRSETLYNQTQMYQQRQGAASSLLDSKDLGVRARTSSPRRQASSDDARPVRVSEIMSQIIDVRAPASAPQATALRDPKVPLNWSLPQLVDIVSVAHHSDAMALLNVALPSMFRSILHLRYVYIVCASRMCELLRERLASSLSKFNTSRVFVVPETVFPFSYNDVKTIRLKPAFLHANQEAKDRTGWTLQQLLKMYIHRVLGPQPVGSNSAAWPELLPTAVVVDADVVWVRPISFIEEGAEGPPRCWYSLASSGSGAFWADTMFMPDLLERLATKQKPGCSSLSQKSCKVTETDRVDCGFPHITKEACLGRGCCWEPSEVRHPLRHHGGTVPWCFMASRHAFADTYTAITHHTVLQRDVTEELLQSLEQAYSQEAWEALAVMQPCMSEYNLYFAWAAHQYPERVAIRFLPYMNGGKNLVVNTFDYSLMRLLDVHPPLAYAALHDDWRQDSRCCVNSRVGNMSCSHCQERVPDRRAVRMPRITLCMQGLFPHAGKEDREQAACRISRFVSCLYSQKLPEAESHWSGRILR
eukprot:TRINITY_DN41539_c0_g1_i1.p1 TRINITY_DN41539_c0_g1~~TRINITY_DN41539_c0_g1_i1.p1  ORF type:complete len:611 (+),score=50.89 TRINITY_DN41539_c0_g1_i1:57-1889(+)